MLKVHIYQERCIGCGCCIDIAPYFFKFTSKGYSEFIGDPAQKSTPRMLEDLTTAALSCPVRAIDIIAVE